MMSMNAILAFGPSGMELIIIALVVLLLFGATKIPQLMRGMGQGIGEFKKGLKEGTVEEEEKSAPIEEKKSAPSEEKKEA